MALAYEARRVTGRSTRFFLSLGNVFSSLVLGAVALGMVLFYFPDATLQLFKWAGAIREALIAGNWPARYEGVMPALIDERQIVYMGFVLAIRVVVGLVGMLGSKLTGGGKAPEFPH